MRNAWQRRLRGGLSAVAAIAVMQAAALGIGPSIATAQDASLEQAKVSLAAGNPNSAYQMLKPMEPDRAGEPAFDYLLGISALDSGRYTEAVFALERVLAVEPGNALARAEIARAYVQLGERETAQRELETVRARGDVPDEAKAAIARYLAAFRDTAGDAMSWRAYIAVTLGYDSNVNSATADDTVGILGRAFNLSPTAQESSDVFGMLSAGASLVAPVSRTSAVIAGLTADNRLNEDERRFDQANLSGYLGATHRDGPWSYTGVIQYGTFRLNRDAFRNAFGATVQARRALDSVSQVSGYGQLTRLTYPTQPIRNAYRYVVGIGYSRSFLAQQNGLLFAGAFGAAEDEIRTNVQHLGHVGVGANVGVSADLFSDSRGYIKGAIERRKYGGTEPLFGNRRHDTRLSLSLGLDYEVAQNWVISPNATFVRNNSNVPINDYDRAKFELQVRRNFGN